MGCCLLNFKPSICFILKRLQSTCSASVGLFLRAFPNVVILFIREHPHPNPPPLRGREECLFVLHDVPAGGVAGAAEEFSEAAPLDGHRLPALVAEDVGCLLLRGGCGGAA